jgi:hypothetical protein
VLASGRILACGVALNIAALGLLAVAYVKRDDVTIEGAYFNQAVGADETAATFAAAGSSGPWIIAAAACLIAGTALFVVGARSSRSV